MFEWPNLLATLAIDTPAKSKRDACVWRSPWIDITGISALRQCFARILFTVELYTFLVTKIGFSSGSCLINSAN